MSEIVAIKNEVIKMCNGMEIGVMLSLNYLCEAGREIMTTNYFIQDILFEEMAGSRRVNDSITQAVEGLHDKGIIKIRKTIGRGNNASYFISNKNVLVDNSEKDGYTYIDMKWVRKVSGVNLLKVLMAIVSSFDSETKVGCDTMNNYCVNFNIVSGTFYNHIKQLEKDGVLYVKRGGTLNFDGVVKDIPNSYGLTDSVTQVDYIHQQMKHGTDYERIIQF